MDFRPAYAALAEWLDEELVDVEVTRKPQPWGSFETHPAMLVLENGVGMVTDGDSHQPLRWQPRARLVLYVEASATDEAPGDQMLELVDRVISALTWKAERGEAPAEDGYSTTLGGKVLAAWLDGEIDLAEDPRKPRELAIIFDVTMELDAA